MKIFKTVMPENQSIKIIRRGSHKMASCETLLISSCTKIPGGRLFCKSPFVLLAVCSIV